jgi:hypothetical protein
MMEENDDDDRIKKAREITSFYTGKKDNKKDLFSDDIEP